MKARSANLPSQFQRIPLETNLSQVRMGIPSMLYAKLYPDGSGSDATLSAPMVKRGKQIEAPGHHHV